MTSGHDSLMHSIATETAAGAESEALKSKSKGLNGASSVATPQVQTALARMMDSFTKPGLSHLVRIEELIASLRAMSPEETLEAQRQFEKLRSEGYSVSFEEDFLYWGLGEVAGATAMDALKPQDPDGAAIPGLNRLLTAWAATKPQEAIRWYNALPDGRFRDEMAFWVVDGMSQANPKDGAKYYAGLPIDFQAKYLGNMLWLQSHAEGNNGLSEWFEKYVATAKPSNEAPAEQVLDYQRHAFGEIVGRMAAKDPAKAAAWLDAHQDTGYFTVKEVDRVYQQWREVDLNAAEAWRSQQPSTSGKPSR